MPVKDFKRNPLQEKSDSGSQPAQTDLKRPSARQIFVQVARNGHEELHRPARALAVSGLAGGFMMGLTALGTSISLAELGESGAAQFASHILYPLGFIAVILGRAQLFTENTLYPVALVLAQRRHFWKTLRLWGIVLPTNCIGAFAFAAIAVKTAALRPSYVASMAHLGAEASHQPIGRIFWSAVIGGWIIALVAWLVSGSHSVAGSVMLIWLLTFIVGLGHFAHSIATTGEILAAVLAHQETALGYFRWLWAAVLGNVCGGVLLVTLLEYGQVKDE